MDKDHLAAAPEQHGELPEPSPEVVEAYLRANEEYWRRIDDEPMKLGKWRNGTVQEATAYALRTAIAAERELRAAAEERQALCLALTRDAQDIAATAQAELSTLRQQLEDAVRDAKRYRWMRRIDSFAEWNRVGHCAADALDAAIDAAIEARGDAK